MNLGRDSIFSVSKIIKNKIGYFSVIIFFTAVITFIISLIYVNNMNIKIQLFLFSAVIIIIFIVYSTICMVKINYFFRNGIEARALVIGDIYMQSRTGHYTTISLIKESLSPLAETNRNIKNGVTYRYSIGTETYESKYRFVINGDTMHLKQSSVITVLANPKNDTIIKDIFVKSS